MENLIEKSDNEIESKNRGRHEMSVLGKLVFSSVLAMCLIGCGVVLFLIPQFILPISNSFSEEDKFKIGIGLVCCFVFLVGFCFLLLSKTKPYIKNGKI